jgi:hypothetical protein
VRRRHLAERHEGPALKRFAPLLGLGVAAILLAHGTGEPGVREVIRWTARCSVCLAMVADGVRGRSRLVPVGLFWIWGVFLVSYGTRAIRMPGPFGFAVALLAAAMLIRLSSPLRIAAAAPTRERAG